MKEKSLTHNGTPIGYFDEGNGFPIVFIHGFPMDHSVWTDGFIDDFTNKYRVILPDNAGFGKSGLPGEKVTMEYYADCIKAILDNEKITSCAMIGHSMGGYITLNFASRYPDYLKGFGLFHSSAYPDDENKKKDRERVAAFVKNNGSVPFIKELYSKLFAEAFASTHVSEIKELVNDAIQNSTVDGIAAASLAMGDRKDTTDTIKNSSVPVLFIIGKEDKVVPLEKALQQSHLPDRSVICLLEGVGHMGMLESPEPAQAKILSWLAMCNI